MKGQTGRAVLEQGVGQSTVGASRGTGGKQPRLRDPDKRYYPPAAQQERQLHGQRLVSSLLVHLLILLGLGPTLLAWRLVLLLLVVYECLFLGRRILLHHLLCILLKRGLDWLAG